MSEIYKCRMEEYDSDDEWQDINANYSEGAAMRYAEKSDIHMAMELFNDDQARIILVRDPKGVESKFICRREFTPMYITKETTK